VPFSVSILDQFEEALRGSSICPRCPKLLFELSLRAQEVQGIEHFIGQRICEYIHMSAYCADLNKILIHFYARLGRAKGPTSVCSDSFKECLCELRRDRRTTSDPPVAGLTVF